MAVILTAFETWAVLGTPMIFEDDSSPASTYSNWDFGDGQIAGGQQVEHIYANPGTYTVTLSTNNGTAQQVITIAEPYEVSINQQTLSIPLRKVDDDDYSSIGLRGLRSTYPTVWYDNGNFPLRTLYFWPVPAQNWAVELWLWAPLNQDVDLDAELNLPPGYERYLRYKLALELAPEFGKEVPPNVVAIANEAEANVKRLNQQTPLAHPSTLARAAQGRRVAQGTGIIDSVAFRSGGWMLEQNT